MKEIIGFVMKCIISFLLNNSTNYYIFEENITSNNNSFLFIENKNKLKQKNINCVLNESLQNLY